METVLFQVILISALFDAKRIVFVTRQQNFNDVDLFPLSIIHINDFHARYLENFFAIFQSTKFGILNFYRFEETNEAAGRCQPNEKCIGGYARAVTVIKDLQRTRVNPIYLNAGDNFQGTFWYTVGGWNVTSYFLNMLNADAVVSKIYCSETFRLK